MNIFVLDSNIIEAARAHNDRHIVKMPTEAVQLLCSAHDNAPMKKSHNNHPCAKWTRESLENYMWLLDFAQALFDEYTNRYKKIHGSLKYLEWCRANIPDLPSIGLTPFAQAMPVECKDPDAIVAYRKYYIDYKWDPKVFRWAHTPMPEWFREGVKTSAQKSLKKVDKKKM